MPLTCMLFDSNSLSVLNVLKIGGVQLYFGGDRVLTKVQSRFSLYLCCTDYKFESAHPWV